MNSVRIACVLMVALSAGCSKEKMTELVDQAKETASSVAADVSTEMKTAAEQTVAKVESVKEAAADVSGIGDATGKATMTLDAPTEFAASYVQLIAVNEGRPSVLKISSSKDGQDDVFPAFLIQAKLSDTDLDSLAGQTVSARLFAQKQEGGPIWFSPEEKPVPVTLAMEEGNWIARIDNASVMNSSSDAETSISGTFQCVVHP
ncbi:hypothetical protein CA51_33490 [Rosistilla oblonga]|uniref:hypothetical protein n=1 Tax=Rosistilla oblonga TaxID=2527990 RepID=UPI001189409F|nr:hypothetical protein [Rosistilla oblonga]QDV13459.1 hypothetical protein CA51_33490 [Rosistilla oblonga]